MSESMLLKIKETVGRLKANITFCLSYTKQSRITMIYFLK